MFAMLDFRIEVDKRTIQETRRSTADGSLAHAGKPNEDNV